MSGGTLVLANPLTLDFGLQFSGGGITSGILNIFGDSTQSAIMTVNGTTINNSGHYDITLTSGNVFSGGSSNFNNSGMLLAHADIGTVSFNMALDSSGTVSAESGTFNLISGGTVSGTASAAAGAVLQFGSNFTFTDGAQFAGAGLVQFNNSTTTTLSGTIVNNGNVRINSTGSFTDFVLSDDLTITGSGVLTLVNADRVRGSGVLTNAEHHPGRDEQLRQPREQCDRSGQSDQRHDRRQCARPHLERRSQDGGRPNESRPDAGEQWRHPAAQRQRRRWLRQHGRNDFCARRFAGPVLQRRGDHGGDVEHHRHG